MRPLLILLATSALYAQTPSYPGAVVTNSQLMVAANGLQTALVTSIGTSDTTIVVASGTGIGPNMLMTIDSEIMAVCNVTGNSVSVGKSSCPNADGRGFDGTTATAHAAGKLASFYIDAWHHNAVTAEIKAIEAALGPNLSNVLVAGPQPANRIYAGPTSGSSAAPTFRAMVSADLPSVISANTSGTSASFTGILTGDVTGTQTATVVSRINGILPSPSATIDATNANNITTGTLSYLRLPLPTPTTVGAVQSRDCTAGGQFVQAVRSDGTLICATPSGSGNVMGPGAVTNGFLATWGNSNNTLTAGLPVSATPGANTVLQSNSSAHIASGWMPSFTGDATSTAGSTALTLSIVTLPGTCGDATHSCSVTDDAKGRILTMTPTAIDVPNSLGSSAAGRFFASPPGSSGNPSMRVIAATDLPATITSDTSGSAASITGKTFMSGTVVLVATGSLTNGNCLAIGAGPTIVDNGSPCGSGGGSGTVTSVALTLPGIFSVSGSPVTTTGTLAATLATQTANLIFAGPSSGGAATPTFRAMAVADMPSGYPYGSLSGAPSLPISVANGGTGATTATLGFNALSPMTTLGDTIYGAASGVGTRLAGNTTATKNLLCQTGTGSVSAAPVWCTLSTGDIPGTVVTSVVNDTNVTGSISAGALTLGWTGTLAAGRLNTNVVQAVTNGTNVTGSISSQNLTLGWTGQLSIANGGTGQATALAAFNALSPMTTLGDVLYGGSAGTATRLAGNTTTTRKFLNGTGDGVNAAAPNWGVLTVGDIPSGYSFRNLANSPFIDPRNYTFTASPSGTLSAGVQTITLTPCPIGVNGADTFHYLYVAGTGTPEAALISQSGGAGSCTSGGGTGTVKLLIANSHSAGFTLSSATSGTAEAFVANVSTGGRVLYPAGGVHFQAPAAIPTSNGGYFGWAVAGQGNASVIFQDSNTFDTFAVRGTSAVIFEDLYLDTNFGTRTAGAGIAVYGDGTNPNSYSAFRNVQMTNQYNGFDFEASELWAMDHAYARASNFAVLVNNVINGDDGDNVISNSILSGAVAGLRWNSGGGLRLMSNKFQGGAYGLQGVWNSAQSSGVLNATGNSVENFSTSGFSFTCDASTSAGYGRFEVTGNEFAPLNTTATTVEMSGNAACAPGETVFSGNQMYGPTVFGAHTGHITLNGNYFHILGGTAPAIDLTGVPGNANYVVSGNIFFPSGSFIALPSSPTGIAVDLASVNAPFAASSCGSGATTVGNHGTGRFTIGSGATACTLTFAENYGATPTCLITPVGFSTQPTYSVSSTAITVSTGIASSTYAYKCGF